MNLSNARLFQYVETLFTWCIRLGSAAILASPLLITPGTLFLFIFGKIIYFRIIVEALLAMWLFMCAYKRSYRPNFRHPLVFTLSLFFLILIISSLFGVDLAQSFWASQERMTGIFTLLHAWAWFLMMTTTFRTWKDWRMLIIASICVSLLVCLYGIFQKLHLRIVLPELDPNRMSATLGNPIFLGVYALMSSFFSAYLLVRERNRLWRLTFFIALLVNAGVLFSSASRGVALAAGVSLLLFGLSFTFFIKDKSRQSFAYRCIGGAVLAGLLVIGLLYTSGGKKWAESQLPPFAQKLVYKSFDDPGRLALVRIGLSGFIDKPLTGWGWENFGYVNNTHLSLFKGVTSSPWNDRSHNQVIDVLALSGVFGGISYLAVWALLFFMLGKKIRKTDERNERSSILIVFFLFVAYFIQNLTVFDTPAPLILLYFSLAFAYFLIEEKSAEDVDGREQGLLRKKERERMVLEHKMAFPMSGFLLFPLLFVVFGASSYYFNIQPFTASTLGIQAVRLAQRDPIASMEVFKKVFELNTFVSPEFREHLADSADAIVGSAVFEQSIKKEFVLFAVSENERNVSEAKRNLRHILRMAYLYRTGSEFDPSLLKKSEDLLKRGLVWYPDNYQLEQELAEIYAYKKQYAQALEYAQKVVSDDIEPTRARWYLAATYARAGNIEKALEESENAMMENCRLLEYDKYVLFLAQNMPTTADRHVLEYFATLAAAYGAKSPSFVAARNEIFSRAQSVQEGQITQSSTQAIAH